MRVRGEGGHPLLLLRHDGACRPVAPLQLCRAPARLLERGLDPRHPLFPGRGVLARQVESTYRFVCSGEGKGLATLPLPRPLPRPLP